MVNIKRITEKIIIVFAVIIVAEIYLPLNFSNGSWVEDAFGAAYNFLNEPLEVDTTSIPYKLYTGATGLVKAANRVLLVLLAGVSIISLSIVGVRYIFSGASPRERDKAQQQLRTVFTGMLYGFGAFIIWNIAMSIITIILQAMAQSQ